MTAAFSFKSNVPLGPSGLEMPVNDCVVCVVAALAESHHCSTCSSAGVPLTVAVVAGGGVAQSDHFLFTSIKNRII